MGTDLTQAQCYLDYIAIPLNCEPVKQNRGFVMKKLIVALIAGAAAMSAAQAQTTTPGHAYLGVGVASADHEDGNGFESDGWKASGKIFGGYEFNQNWGVEAGYTDFRKADVNGVTGRGETKGYGYYVAAKATAPINEKFGVYGKLGLQNSQRELNTPLLNVKDHATDAYGAVGVQYNVNQQVALTAEYERYGKSKDFGATANVVTVGARYSF